MKEHPSCRGLHGRGRGEARQDSQCEESCTQVEKVSLNPKKRSVRERKLQNEPKHASFQEFKGFGLVVRFSGLKA